ncbi:Gas vesicle protein G [Sinosporangium album]|uniref:Gas vesicle protein G n=1 Tax=Sinosporangium album TaxID=504805 RepID=A0A1G8C6P7_9ACTN|nr:gas vesicle protein GvpG [Sinosporangium album]SDH40939.1 Gas vesicle protein G [Sinosporangium album]
MGLISLIFTWPVAPVRGVIRLGELIQEQAERHMRDPTVVRRRLEELEEARAAGHISDEEQQRAMEDILLDMSAGSHPLDDLGVPRERQERQGR